jgi:hypothetical protein
MEKAVKEHGETKSKFRLTKLDPADLAEIRLSAIELAKLEPLIQIESETPGKLKAVSRQLEANA